MLNEQQHAFGRVLDLMEDAGCLPYVILIGSWAEFVYRESGLLADYAPNIRTMDIDFLIRNMRRPVPAANLVSAAREHGFFVESDVLNGTTKLLDTTGLEVEFLIGQMGSGEKPALKTNVGVTAQALRHMEMLSGNIVEASCFGHKVIVPTPEAYAVHKMVINARRGNKTDKDAQAVLGIWPHLDKRLVDSIVSRLSKKERRCVGEFAEKYGIVL